MAATVPESRLNLVQSGVEISRSVRGVSWIDSARLANWISGRGSMDVPAHAPMVRIAGSGSSDFTYRVKPRYQTTRYALSLVLTSPDGPTTADVTVPIGGTTHTVNVQPRLNARPETLIFERSSQSTTETTLDFRIAAGGTEDVDVECVSIEALPRATLAQDTSDLGVDRLQFFPRQPIYEASLSTQLTDVVSSIRDSARRVGIYQHSFGTDSPFSTSSTTFVDVFDEDHEELGRYLYNGDTTRTHSWRVLAYADVAGTKGEVRITNTSGASTVIDVPLSTTSATWLPATGGSPSTFTCDCEDNTTANGRRRSGGDMHAIEARVTSASGTIYIESISIWEA